MGQREATWRTKLSVRTATTRPAAATTTTTHSRGQRLELGTGMEAFEIVTEMYPTEAECQNAKIQSRMPPAREGQTGRLEVISRYSNKCR